MNSENISIKGIRQGLLVTIPEGDWGRLVNALQGHLGESPAFFRGGRIILDVGNRELGHTQIENVHSMISRDEVELWALVSSNPSTEAAARELGLVTELRGVRVRKSGRSPGEDGEPSAGATVVRRTFRSGQSLRHPGDVVIIGDVNPGAEIVAGGSIIVWGRVRGLVHAGALGDEEAVVCALDLAPTQLRIGGHIARSPEQRRSKPVPEQASIRDGRIVAIPWPGE